MADLNPNIIMGAQLPQIQSPLDNYSKAMTLQSLAAKNQTDQLQARQAQQDFGDNQALRNATANHTTVDENGNPTIDRPGMLKELGTTSPSLVPKAAMSFGQQDAQIQEQKIKTLHGKLDAMGQFLGGVHDQDSYVNALQQAKSIGADISQFPPQYDPNVVKHAQFATLNAKDQIEATQKQQEIGIKEEDLSVKRQQFQDTKQTESFKDLMGHAESSRQLPDVKQAYLDRYNTQKIKDLIGTGDPNKLPKGMVGLLIGEVGKVAQGQAPTEETLKTLSPHDAKLIMAGYKEYLTSHPQASEQGAFVNVFKNYANTLQAGANKVINSNIGKLGEMYKEHIKPSDYQKYQDTLVNGNPYAQDPNNSKASNDSNDQEIHPSLKGKSLAELKAMKAQMSNASK